MLGVGSKFPDFNLQAVLPNASSEKFCNISNRSNNGMWLIPFFWPKDFTFVCPTEIIAFNELFDEFKKRNAQLLGISIDSEFVHSAWKEVDKALSNLKFPMLSDIKRELSQALGIIDLEAGVSQRATYIVDPEDKIRFVMITDLNIGRSPKEVLRVLDALQTGELCPCAWEPGEAVIRV